MVPFLCTNYSVSVGKNNRYGHPDKEVLNNQKKYRIDGKSTIKTCSQ